MQTGKVWLVGAGPGAKGLMTLRGVQLLEKADVVFYDSLVGDEVLALIPQDVRKIHVGKRARRHTLPQEEISRYLAEEAAKGYRVVRLKGGDPFIFGRGPEELDVLIERGIPFEVVPGVTSAAAVPEYCGVPVTHRDHASSLHIITGHRREGEDYDIDFESLASAGGTLVFLMGIGSLHDICSRLMQAGMREDMPAAILQQGTTAGQKRIGGTVSTIEEEMKKEGVVTPAIIVVGEVCKLAPKYDWWSRLPLAGRKILVTRPAEKDSVLAGKLRELGAEVLEIPAIRIIPSEDTTRLDESLGRIGEYDWIVFTSPRGVKIFFDHALEKGVDARSMTGRFAAIGAGTAKALRGCGIIADLVPDVYDGAHLGKALATLCAKGAHVLIPRSSIGGKELIRELEAVTDIRIDDVPIYDTVAAEGSILDVKGKFEKGEIDCAAFTSASAVRAFVQQAEGLDMSGVTAACIGRQTAAEAEAAGMKIFTAQEATMDSMAASILDHLK